MYAGVCEGGDGLEGEAECRATREARVGLYARDNSPNNVVSTLTCVRVTGCWSPESDCDHATYERGARVGDPRCDRDNTAFGLMLLVP